MHNVRPEKTKTNQSVQTRIFIRSDRDDQPAKALSNRLCQTIITTEPDEDIQATCALFQFLPQQEIDKGAIHEIKLEKAALLQWKLPLISYELIKKEQHRHQKELSFALDSKSTLSDISDIANHNNNHSLKSALRKKEPEDNLDEWGALLALSLPQAMADELVDEETQTNFTVRPHVLGDEQVAQLAKTSSPQTSLTFDPDASITDVQPILTKDIDHFHSYISTLTPKLYIESSKEDLENEQLSKPITVPVNVNVKTSRVMKKTSVSACECPPNIKTKDGDDKVAKTSAKVLRHQNGVDESASTIDQFIDMIIADMADKSIAQDVKEFVLKELAEFADNVLPTAEFFDDNVPASSSPQNLNELMNQTPDEEFENVVSEIMNSCVYNIEDQLKKITATMDSYQKDLKNTKNQQKSKKKVMPTGKQNAAVEVQRVTRGTGEGVSAPPIEMQGDSSHVQHDVDVLCECCNLTAGGAAVPMLRDSLHAPIAFDVIVGPDRIEVQNKATSSPSTGEQVIRFSIVPSQPHVNRQGEPYSMQPNVIEIHLSCPDVRKVQLDERYGNHLGTGPEEECTVVLPPKRIMRTSEEYLDINGTSQKIGMMFEQDADHVEPYISNVEDTTVPINMLHPANKLRNVKLIAKLIEAEEIKDCPTSIEVPWDLITLQVKLVEMADETYQGGCCRDFIDPSCTRTNCPMLKYHSADDVHSIFTVQFQDKKETKERKNEKYVVADEFEMDYEPAVTRKSLITASTSEIHGSLTDLLESESVRPVSKRIPVETLIYDVKFDRHSEPYMDDMYNNFPDDNLMGLCDSRIEIPWEQFTLPTAIKIRKTKKTKPQAACNKTNISNEGNNKKSVKNKMNNLDNIDSNPRRDAPGNPEDDVNSDFGLNLSYVAETVSNLIFVDGAAASQKSMSHYSIMSDYRFLAKRCPKNVAIGINLFGRQVTGVTAGSEMFEIADNISTRTTEIKPFTNCLNKSEFGNLLKQNSGETSAIISHIGNMPTETQSLGGNGVMIPPSASTDRSQSMPEIPSRANVVFQVQPVKDVLPTSDTSKGTKVPGSPKKQADNDLINSALDSYRAELQPLREALDKLKQEVKELNLLHDLSTFYMPYPAAPQQYPNMPPMQYASPSIRHTTAVSNGCGTRTPARKKPPFSPEMSQYNQMPYLAPGMPSPMPSPMPPPMSYYLPPHQYPRMPYIPFPQPASDMFGNQEFSPIKKQSCKSRRKNKSRKKEGTSVTSKESEIIEQGSSSRKSHRKKNNGYDGHNIETHYGPKEILDDSSEVSVKANYYAINKKYNIEISPETVPNVQNEMNTSEASHSFKKQTAAFVDIPDTSQQHQSIPEAESIQHSQNTEQVFVQIPEDTPGSQHSSSSL